MKQLQEAKTKMSKTINTFYSQIQGMRQGELDSGFVSTIKVSAYGQQTPVGHISLINEEKGRISIHPFDSHLVNSIAKDLKNSGLEAYKFSKEEVVVSKPPRSGEDTEMVCSQVKKLGEEAKVSIRNIRKKCKQQIKRLDLDEAESNQLEKQLQEYTDQAIDEIDQSSEDKISKLKGKTWKFGSK